MTLPSRFKFNHDSDVYDAEYWSPIHTRVWWTPDYEEDKGSTLMLTAEVKEYVDNGTYVITKVFAQ